MPKDSRARDASPSRDLSSQIFVILAILKFISPSLSLSYSARLAELSIFNDRNLAAFLRPIAQRRRDRDRKKRARLT